MELEDFLDWMRENYKNVEVKERKDCVIVKVNDIEGELIEEVNKAEDMALKLDNQVRYIEIAGKGFLFMIER